MDTLKKTIISSVLVASGVSSSFAILLVIKSKNIKRDPTYPLLASVFSTGITGVITYLLISVSIWGDIQDNLILTKLVFFCQLYGATTNYVSMAILSSLKLFALVTPFAYKRMVKVRAVKTVTVIVWLTLAFAMSLISYFSEIKFSSFTETVRLDMTKPEKNRGRFFSRSLLYISIGILLLSSIGFVTGAVRYKFKTRNALQPEEMLANKEKRKEVAKVLWSSKGIWVLAVVRLIVHLPFFALVETKLRESLSSFFVLWLLSFTGPIWDAVCYIGFHKELRKLASQTVCWWRPRDPVVKQASKTSSMRLQASSRNLTLNVLEAREPTASILANVGNISRPKDLDQGNIKPKTELCVTHR